MALHYFDRPSAPPDDLDLRRAIEERHVPETCLLAGHVIWTVVRAERKPCDGCNGPRDRCLGTPRLDRDGEARAADLAALRSLIVGDDDGAALREFFGQTTGDGAGEKAPREVVTLTPRRPVDPESGD